MAVTAAQCIQTTDPLFRIGCRAAGFPTINASDQAVASCIASGNDSAQPITDHATNVSANWHPTGTFDSVSIRTIVSQVLEVVNSAGNVLLNAISDTPAANSDALDLLASMQDNLDADGSQSLNYLHAAQAAEAQDGLVWAPNIKHWVENSLTDAASAVSTAQALQCIKPWWVSAVQDVVVAAGVLEQTVLAISGVVAQIGKEVLTAVEAAPTTIRWGGKILGFTFTYGPWILGGLTLLWVVRKIKRL